MLHEFCVQLYLLFWLNFSVAKKKVISTYGTNSRSTKKEHPDKKHYWENELNSLGVEPRRQNELYDKEELEALAEIIEEVYYQDYKTAYSNQGKDNREVSK